VNEDTGRQLHGWDATTYRADVGSPTMRSPVIGLLLLETAPDWDLLVARLERVSRTVPMLRERVLRGPFGLANPRLGVDPSFDLDFHLRRYRLPQPATWSDVLAEARRISLAQLDPDRPLWRATVLEGLPDGRAAFILKLHHALADGQATVQLGAQIFDFAPDATAPTDLPEPPAAVQPGMLDVLTADVRDTLERAAGRVGGVVRAAPGTAWRAVRDPRGAVGDGVGLARSLARFTLPAGGRSLSPLLRQRGTTYRFATIALPFRDLRTAAKDAGFTVNDAFLSAVAGGMRRYHERHDAPVDELRFNLPISLRTEGAEAANAVTIARFPFAIAEPDPVARMAPPTRSSTPGAPSRRSAWPTTSPRWAGSSPSACWPPRPRPATSRRPTCRACRCPRTSPGYGSCACTRWWPRSAPRSTSRCSPTTAAPTSGSRQTTPRWQTSPSWSRTSGRDSPRSSARTCPPTTRPQGRKPLAGAGWGAVHCHPGGQP
jgi:WS/DGAT/MGAT family acyltransferase